jgi:nucleoside-diphosphate-sugar epimerase
MKSALVIAPRSMLGAQLCKDLRARGVHVLTAGRSPEDDIHFDLQATSVPTVDPVQTADTVFHCAASFAADTEAGINQNFQGNTASAWHAAAMSAKLGARRLVYAGTVWSSCASMDRANYNSYGLSKGLGEQILEWALNRSGIGFCSLRFSQLYDVDGLCCRHQPWFGRIVAYAARGQNLRLPESLGSRNFLHVEDAAEFMIRAAERDVSGMQEIVHPEFLTCDQLAEMAYAVFDCGGQVVRAPEKQPFRKVGFPEAGTVFERLGQPGIDMRTGLRMIKDRNTWTAFGPMDVQ